MSIASSQCLRFIDEINGCLDTDEKIRSIKSRIKQIRRNPKTPYTKALMREMYGKLYELQFQPDYVCIVMDSNRDYDTANNGFSINGIQYCRLLGTNGGIKNSTIVYVNNAIYDKLKERLDNGRDMSKELVPAKLEAYQALICSGSTPIPQPNGIIVVNDCITHFKDDVILINDDTDGEPLLTYENDYEIEKNCSDGCGMMLPSYSRKVNQYLTGEDEVMSGMNTRYAWTKGMVYTFDFIEFAEKVAGTYEIKDAWGDIRDIRDAEVILTVSMLKLWDSYKSWEDYYQNCQKYHYEFSTPKITPKELENVRNMNYQFLQSYDLSDDELLELCQPTIDEIKDVLGMDYRKSLVFLSGYSLNDKTVNYLDNYIKALMVAPELINDPFIRKKIYSMIRKRIELAKKGSIKVDANYAMISGDLYALCQSMFGLEITGLLKSGELYHKYWIDKGSKELVCFRAPMTCHNNIRKLKLNSSDECLHWFQYINTAIILNSWDTTCDAMNGADMDGDTNMDTDNPILLSHTKNSPAIICMQRKATKKVPTEDDIISSNKLAFNDDIGTVTNHVTSMFDVQAGFERDSEEYKTLEYRIMCGQLYQQNTIDRAKGIIANPMPDYWYSHKANKSNENKVSPDVHILNRRVIAPKKPYFMIYVYPNLRKSQNEYIRKSEAKSTMLYGTKISEVTDQEFIKWYHELMPTGNNPCTVNRICWLLEDKFKDCSFDCTHGTHFDYSILKSNVEYSKNDYNKIFDIYNQYLIQTDNFHKRMRSELIDKDMADTMHEQFIGTFVSECQKACTNEDELCDIVLDICYLSEKSKQFAWDICGDVILKNLIKKNNNTLYYPLRTDGDGDFEYGGIQFVMQRLELKTEGNSDDCVE